MSAAELSRRTSPARIAYGVLALLVLVSLVLELVKHDTGYWQLAVFGLAPDVALIYGASAALERRQLHPRAVWLYNLVHRF